MNLSELAVAAYLYECFTGYDESYFAFLDRIGSTSALKDALSRSVLLKWLNKWGCRQFALAHHKLASQQLLKWYKAFQETLPSPRTNLWEVEDEKIDSWNEMFEALAASCASIRRYRSGSRSVKVGSTGAAKILFALRPKAFPPWDDPIRRNLGYKGVGAYVRFLKDTKLLILDLKRRCERNGIAIETLPSALNRPRSTVPKLIDEYYWVTITNRCQLPSVLTVKTWASWK